MDKEYAKMIVYNKTRILILLIKNYEIERQEVNPMH